MAVLCSQSHGRDGPSTRSDQRRIRKMTPPFHNRIRKVCGDARATVETLDGTRVAQYYGVEKSRWDVTGRITNCRMLSRYIRMLVRPLKMRFSPSHRSPATKS